MSLRSMILGTGRCVPDRVVTNAELVTYVGGQAQWIEERTGIVERRWARASTSTSMLATEAAREALADAHLEPDQIDALIVATLSPDMAFPGCGVMVQDALGVPGIPALDVRNQCSGYLYALSVADAWLRAGVYQRVLVIGAEIHSAGLDFSEEGRSITALFGDGAGAVVLHAVEGEDTQGVQGVWLGADGSGAGDLACERPGSRGGTHISIEDIRNKRHFPTMNGRRVYRRAVETLTRELELLFERHDLREPERWERVVIVPHQANRRINEHLARALTIPPERVVHTIDRFGNTTAASIPMALDVARRDGRIQPGSLVVHAAFGSGYTWGTALIGM